MLNLHHSYAATVYINIQFYPDLHSALDCCAIIASRDVNIVDTFDCITMYLFIIYKILKESITLLLLYYGFDMNV